MSKDYWRTEEIYEIIKKEFGKDISIPTIHRYMRRLGYSLKKPILSTIEDLKTQKRYLSKILKMWLVKSYQKVFH
ncbi:helix-turn-helix domain-containing protein [Methanotorris formicicus]|uniref:helix-turn-helix domain-containing protein n=1 Tax=Methanotorris formicicus TaxID=213185 RepID=UPI00373AEEA5